MSTPYEDALARIVSTNPGAVVAFAFQAMTEEQRGAFLAAHQPNPAEERAALRRCIETLYGLLNPARYDEVIGAIGTIHDSIEVPGDDA